MSSEELRLQEEEIAWASFIEEQELMERLSEWPFIPDGVEIFNHYRALRRDTR